MVEATAHSDRTGTNLRVTLLPSRCRLLNLGVSCLLKLGIELALSLAGLGLQAHLAVGYEQPSSSPPLPMLAQPTSSSLRRQPQHPIVLPDGVYLYGETPQAEQIGRSYVVFEVQRQSVVGAFYAPHSSFDCFSGNLKAGKLALTVVDSYTRQPPNTQQSVGAIPADSALAASGIAYRRPTSVPDPSSYSYAVELQTLNRVAQVSENDLRILGVCKAEFQKQPTR